MRYSLTTCTFIKGLVGNQKSSGGLNMSINEILYVLRTESGLYLSRFTGDNGALIHYLDPSPTH